jgi:hypothetical protein
MKLMTNERKTAGNTGLAKVAVQCSADTFVVNQSLVLRINIVVKSATFAKPENVMPHPENETNRKNRQLN